MKKLIYLFLAFGLFTAACQDEEAPEEVLGDPVIHSISSEKGYPLSVLVIEGENFSRKRVNNEVKINEVQARIIHFNEHTITVEVPENGSTGAVTVNVNGRSATGPVFAYMEAPALYKAETYAGTGGTAGYAEGDRLSAKFNLPEGIAMDSKGNLIIADRTNNVIRMINPAGQVSLVAGVPGSSGTTDGNVSTARFFAPWRVALDQNDNIYVADRSNHRIRKVDMSSKTVSTIAGSSSGFADGAGTAAKFNRPVDLHVAADGTIYVADEQNDRIRKITPEGEVSTLAGGGTAAFADGPGATARFNKPCGIDMTKDGNIVVADSKNFCLRMITPAGVTSTIAGKPGTSGFKDGAALEALFNGIYGVKAGEDGSLYISEIGANHAIRRMTPAGDLYTIAGSGRLGLVNGEPAASTRFNVPTDMAIDAQGKIYVADMENHVIRLLTRIK